MSNLPPDIDSEDRISLEEDLAMTEDDSDAFYEDELRGQQRDADIDRLRHRMTLLFQQHQQGIAAGDRVVVALRFNRGIRIFKGLLLTF